MNFFRNIIGKGKPSTKRTRLTLETLEDRIVPYAGHGLQFSFTQGAGGAMPTQQIMSDVQQAANLWSSILSDDIVVNIRVDLVGNIAAGGIASGASVFKTASLTDIRTALAADETSLSDITAVAHLPQGNTAAIYTTNPDTGLPIFDDNGTDNNMFFTVPQAELKAMGLRAANDPGLDGVIQIKNNLSVWDFDRSDGISPGKYDFVGAMVHEMGHLFGFVSGAATMDVRSKPNGPAWSSGYNVDGHIIATPLDLFRDSTASIQAGANYDIRADKASKYFSIDGGATSLGVFATGLYNGDGGEAGHWKDNMNMGIMDPGSPGGELLDIKWRDVQALDVIGWNVVMDMGDAPDTAVGTGAGNYQTTLADNGPRHITFSPSALANDPAGAPKVFLGAGVNAELNGQPTPTANGDTDDGIAAMPTLVTGTTINVTVTSSATAAKHAVLDYFIDLNQNGRFDDPGEAFTVVLTSASQVVPIVIPAGATLGNSFARFRISTAGGLGATGPADDGECEDYQVVIAAPHGPTVGSIDLLEDNLSAPIWITAMPGDGIASFKISGITGGTLFMSDGVTPIANGMFISALQGQVAVRFLPSPNSNSTAHFDVESSQDGVGVVPQTDKATCTITIIPVGDTPQVANIATLEGKLSGAILISRNAADGAEVTSFRISGITGGTLFKSNGMTPINNGDFVTFAEAQASVRFLPAANSTLPGHFLVESSQDGSTVAAQSGKAMSTITVTPISSVQIAGVVGGSQLAVTAVVNNGFFSGAGKLTAPNGQYYNLTVKSGSRTGTLVKLQGTASPPGSSATIAFTLEADSATGFITFSYVGAKGLLIVQTTFGAVLFQ